MDLYTIDNGKGGDHYETMVVGHCYYLGAKAEHSQESPCSACCLLHIAMGRAMLTYFPENNTIP